MDARSILDGMMRFFFPRTCAVCGGDVGKEGLCGPCLEGLPRWQGLSCAVCGAPLPDGGARCFACRRGPRAFALLRTAGLYEGTLKDLLWSLKSRNRWVLGRTLGLWMSRLSPELNDVDAVAPVPLHFLKRHRRGHNPAELLARGVAEAAGLPLHVRALERRRWTRPQKNLRREGRLANVQGAFTVPRPALVRGRGILLVDDVCATGATLEACARALRAAGARRIYALAAARRVYGLKKRPKGEGGAVEEAPPAGWQNEGGRRPIFADLSTEK